jgi:putative tryptophan/tyrosine transport system substrate-binding protein
MRRREFIAGLAGAAAWPMIVRAQQPAERMRRIAVLTAGSFIAATSQTMVREELAKLGWVEGRNLRIDYRASGGAGGLIADAEELVNLNPDVIFAFTGAAARAAQRHTQIIPIVFVGGGDPTESNLVGDVARPTGNVTGFANNFVSLGGKWLELLKQATPRLARVAHLYDPEFTIAGGGPLRAAVDVAAPQLAITVIRTPVRNSDEIARAINTFVAEPNGALLITGTNPGDNVNAILRLALQHRLPTMFGAGKFVAEGLLMSYGPDFTEMVRGASSYLDRILRGAKPSDLPVQYPTKLPLVINLKTAKALGLTVPETLLVQADELIQ